MRQSDLLSAAAITAALLAACSGNGTQPSVAPGISGPPAVSGPANHSRGGVNYAIYRNSNGRYMPRYARNATLIPEGMLPAGSGPLHGNPPPPGVGKGGIYVSELLGDAIYEYSHKNTANNPPNCSISGTSLANDIAADNQGNMLAPNGGNQTIQVFSGNGSCGSQIGSVSDGYGEPVDVSSADAVSGTIAVGNIFDTNFGAGSLSLCTISAGCTTNLTSSNVYLSGQRRHGEERRLLGLGPLAKWPADPDVLPRLRRLGRRRDRLHE